MYPIPRFVPKLGKARSIGLDELCAQAGVPCRATGRFAHRPVQLLMGDAGAIEAEAGGWGAVRITVPPKYSEAAARYALGAMAYALCDVVARESIRGQPWAKPQTPPGRKKTGTALTSLERQRRFQAKLAGAA
jgi:hypothetical protein